MRALAILLLAILLIAGAWWLALSDSRSGERSESVEVELPSERKSEIESLPRLDEESDTSESKDGSSPEEDAPLETEPGEAMSVESIYVATLSVEVRWSDGQLAPGVEVEVRPSDVLVDGADTPLSTGEQASLTLSLRAGRRLSVLAKHGSLETNEVTLTLRPGKRRSVNLKFPGGFAIEGRVTDADGRGVPDAEVRVLRLLRDEATINELFMQSAKTTKVQADRYGDFHAEVGGPGAFEVLARLEASPTAFETARLTDLERTTYLDLRLPRAMTISGRVVREDGQPVKGASLSAQAEQPENPMSSVDNGFNQAVRFGSPRGETDVEGRFELTGVHPDTTYLLSCRPEKGRDDTLWVPGVAPGTQDLEIVVDEASLRGAFIRGRLVSGIPGKVVGAFEISPARMLAAPDPLQVTNPMGKLTVDDSRGEFLIEHLEPGATYGLAFEAEGFPALVLEPFEVTLEGVDLGVLELPPAGRLRARVTLGGRPQPGLTVTTSVMPTLIRKGGHENGTTDADGVCVLEDIIAGRHYVGVQRDRETIHYTYTHVEGGQETRLDIALPED